jgi:hypothetical protein
MRWIIDFLARRASARASEKRVRGGPTETVLTCICPGGGLSPTVAADRGFRTIPGRNIEHFELDMTAQIVPSCSPAARLPRRPIPKRSCSRLRAVAAAMAGPESRRAGSITTVAA